MTWNAAKPYNNLPDLPPKADIETKAVLKACIEARAALSALKVAGALIPNQAVLINTIPLLEAQASSEIENIVTTTDALFRYSQFEHQADDPATREALQYRTALQEGFKSLAQRPLSTRTAEQVCSRIKNVEMRVRRVPGTALTNQRTGEVIYTPPVGEGVLREKLANWERFIQGSDGIDPLIRLAVAHYQFEAIHPFTDGNGRTGRVLNLLMLVEQGLLDLPVLYLSSYIIRHKSDYYRLLRKVTTDEAWEEWTLFMLQGIQQTARWTLDKIVAVQKLQTLAQEFVRQHAPAIYSRELVELLFVQPYCRIQNLVAGGLAQRQTASTYLKKLQALGMLREVRVGKEKLFIHPALVQLLSRDDHSVTPYRVAPRKKTD